MLHKKILNPAVSRRGFTLTELLATIGIVGIITGVASVAYMKYYEKSKLFKIQQTAENFHKAAEICLMKYQDDPTKCASFRRLKFDCDYCYPRVCWKEICSYSSSPCRPELNIGIGMEVGRYRGTATYSLSYLPHEAFRIQEVGGTSLKFCSKVRTRLDGVPNTGPVAPLKKPIRKCQTDSDCDTGNGEHCFAPQMPNVGNGVDCGNWTAGTP